MRKRRSFAKALAAMCVLVFVWSCGRGMHDPIESALERNDWKRAFEIASRDSLLSQPQTAGVLGHTAIMLNRNNASYRFLQLISSSNRAESWKRWTQDYVSRHPKRAVAQYFAGDAFMRSGAVEEALKCYGNAIKIDASFALALNARGTIFCPRRDKNGAIADLNKACAIDSGVAAFRANRATMFYDFKVPEAAYDDFQEALLIDPTFALALNGKACASIFVSRKGNCQGDQTDTVSELISEAYKQLNHPIFRANSRALLLEIENRIYLDPKECGSFRASDFLDWQTLCQRSISDKNDLLRFLLGGTIPTEVDAKTVSALNVLLNKQRPFDEFLNSRNIQDSLKRIVAEALGHGARTVGAKRGDMETNRFVIEHFYDGLIAPCASGEPGMNVRATRGEGLIEAGQQFKRDIDAAPPGLADKFTIPLTKVTVGDLIRTPAKLAGDIAIGTGALMDIHDFNRSTSELRQERVQLIDRMKAGNPAYYQQKVDDGTIGRLLQDPGGALADIRRSYVDSDRPYFVTCVNGLGYALR